ncbi:MAG: undecaprenyl-phosphate glucose phosphotransferase [Alphaproteobacteria bacterium]|nr:undecaprenyl-phosphate glucose phosphotransferase [Alphaproteobacteria bacterium]
MRKDDKNTRKLAGSDLLEAISRADAPGLDTGSTNVCAPEQISEESWISPSIIGASVRAIEGLLVAVIGALIWLLYVQEYTLISAIYFVSVSAFSALAVPAFLSLGNLYSVNALLRPFENGPRLLLGWSVFFAALTVLVFFSKLGETYSRVWLGSWYLFGFSGLLVLRGVTARLLRRWNSDNRLNRQAVIIGGGQEAAELIEAINESSDIDVSIVGLFDDRNDDRSPAAIAGYQKLGNVDQLVEFARWKRIDLLILALPLSAENRLAELTRKLWILPVDIRLSAYTQKLRFRPRAYSYIGNIPFFDVFDRPLSGWDWIIKTLEDKVISSLALVLLSPLMALVALAVRLDSPGPVLFKQKRYGFNNELIEVYKFRSMYQDQTDHEASKLVTKNDPRVTRVGRLIRSTSLDELPQLFNVLKGELSLVGPRPHATQAKAEDKLYDDIVEGYFARHRVKPGITGWAQVNGWRGETDTKHKILRRLEHDLYYIENWSVIFDLYILAKTPFALMQMEQAY